MFCPNCRHENETGAAVCFGCGQPLRGAMTVTKGTLLAGRYEIQSQLGKGGMGVVYKAHDRMLDEDVAIKLLRPEATEDEDMARRFRSEIKLARKVTHRNVCRIHEYGEHEGMRYISMELIEGSDLRRYLREGAPSTSEAYDLALQSVQGLEAIHEVGIIHRDLKTPNIMRDQHGVVKLMDFGIAKRPGGDATAGTATGMIMGTPEYMSPEQVRGQGVDARSDVYSMGIVIFEIFTGDVPFRADTPLATLYKHMDEPPPLEGPRASRIPQPLVDVLRKALAKEQSQRYANGAALRAALRKAAAVAGGRADSSDAIEVATEVSSAVTATGQPAAATHVVPRTQAAAESVHAPPPPRPAGVLPSGRLGATAFVAAGAALGLAVLLGLGLLGYRHFNPAAPPVTPPVPTPGPVAAAPTPSVQQNDAPARLEPRLEATPTNTARDAPSPAAAATPTRPSPSTAPPPRAAKPSPALAAQIPAVPTPTPIARPTPSPAPLTSVAATPPPPAVPQSAPAEERGFLQVTVVPGAELEVDGQSHGMVTSKKIALSPGVHKVRLISEEYQPFQRQITVLAGETAKLVVDLAEQAIRKR
jgi:predicted Ser/Thr protein kinase